MTFDFASVRYDAKGLVPVIVQDGETKEVLMLGYANNETLRESLEIGKMVFFSRSRGARWLKGETSGNFLHLVSFALDCDADSILAIVRPHGPACHTGKISCFRSSN